MAIKYTNIFLYQGPRNIAELGFLIFKNYQLATLITADTKIHKMDTWSVRIPDRSRILAESVLSGARPETTEPSRNLYFSMEGQLWKSFFRSYGRGHK
jgi:hypothetical protein